MALSKITNASVADTAVHGRRNLIINGAMQVAQRGTSFSSITSDVYPVDRFFVGDVNAPVGEATVSQSTTAPDDFKYSLKVDVTTADAALVAADQYKIEHRIEGQNISHLNWGTSAAKTVTLSFWIRSNKTGNTQVGLLNSANNRSYVATFTIGVANTWEKKELTVDGDTSGTWLTTNGIGLRLRWGSFGSTYQTSSTDQWIGSQAMSRDDSPINFFDSTDNELYITGIQLEVGEQATPFEHRPYGKELAACQRYYTEIQKASGQVISTTTSILCGVFPTEMRATPSASLGGALTIWQLGIAGSKAQSSSNISVNSNINSASVFNAECANFTGMTLHTATAVAGGDQPLKFDAEL